MRSDETARDVPSQDLPDLVQGKPGAASDLIGLHPEYAHAPHQDLEHRGLGLPLLGLFIDHFPPLR
jgi:hypothetical protein